MAISDILSSDPVTVFRTKINEILDIVNLAAQFQKGTLGARPAASAVASGTFYHCTDTGDISRSDGTTWITTTPGSVAYAEFLGFALDTTTTPNGFTSIFGSPADHWWSANVGSCIYPPTTGGYQFKAPVKGRYRLSVLCFAAAGVSGAFTLNAVRTLAGGGSTQFNEIGWSSICSQDVVASGGVFPAYAVTGVLEKDDLVHPTIANFAGGTPDINARVSFELLTQLP